MSTEENAVEILTEEIRKLRIEVKKLDDKMEETKVSCARMNEHIHFVERVYEVIRAPFSFVLNRVSRVKLPEITDSAYPRLYPGTYTDLEL